MKMHRVLLAVALGVGGVMTTGVATSATTVPPDDTAASDTAPAGTAATEGTEAAAYDVEAVGTCDGGPMEMWERSGGNAPMVDALVAAWNQVYPDCQISLTYIEHAEMVPQLARGIASGDVPDLMGLDLIYGPQFTSAGQLEDITDLIGDDPLVANIVEGHRAVATYEDRLYGVPLYADVSLLFWNKGLFEAGRARPRGAADQPAGDPRHGGGDQRPRQRRLRLLPGGQLRRVQHVHLRPVDLGVWRHDRARRVWRRGARRRQHPDRAGVGTDAAPGGAHRPRRPGGDRCDVREVFGSGNVGIMGTGNFNVALAKEQNPDLELGVTLLPGLESGQTASFAGGDIVTVPKGSERLEDAVEFMKFILSDQVQANVYMTLGNLPTRSDVEPVYDDPDVADTLQALPIAQTPNTPVFFEMLNSPQGPWLQMLQRVYYSDEPIEDIIADTKTQMEDMSCA